MAFFAMFFAFCAGFLLINPGTAQAALSYIGSVEGTGVASSYSVDLTSLNLVEGDLVIVSTGFASTSNGDPGVSTEGYTEVADLYGNDSHDANFSVNWKLMGPSPDTSVSCLGSGNASNGGACLIYAWRGADPSTPLDVTTTVVTGTNSPIPNSPSITPVTSGAVVITAGLSANASLDTAVTAPSGYTNQEDVSHDPGTRGVMIVMASKSWTSGAENPAAWGSWSTSSSASWAAASVAIRPASGEVGGEDEGDGEWVEIASDDFNRTNGPIGSNWDEIYCEFDACPNLVVSGNQVWVENGNGTAVWDADEFPNDQYSEVTMHDIDESTGRNIVGVRMSEDSDGYNIECQIECNLRKDTSTLVSEIFSYEEDMTVRVAVLDNTIFYYKQGILRGSYTDDSSPITSGLPGFGLFYFSSGFGSIDNWSGGQYVEDEGSISISGVCVMDDGAIPCSDDGSNSIRVAVDGVLQGQSDATVDGSWSISGVTVNLGSVVTVFIDGSTGADGAAAVTVYDGVGDITSMTLFQTTVSIGSDDAPTLTNALLGSYDGDDDEDIPFTSNSGTLSAGSLVVLSGTYTPGGAVDLEYSFYMTGGTVNGGSAAWNANTHYLGGGTFNSTSGTYTLGQNASDMAIFTIVSGTFNHNNGTVVFRGSGSSSCCHESTIDINSSLDLYNVTIQAESGSNDDWETVALDSADTITVLNDLTHASGNMNGNWVVEGDLIVLADARGHSGDEGVITMSGAASATYSSATGGRTARLVINKSGGATVTPAEGTTDLTVDGFELTAGSFTAPSGTMIVHRPTDEPDIFTVTSGTFSHNSGTVQINPADDTCCTNFVIDVPTTLTFNNLTILDSGGNSFTSLAPGSGDTIVVLGTFTNNFDGISGGLRGTWELQGNLVTATADDGDAQFTFTGTNDQTIIASGTIPSGTMTINKASGTVTLATDFLLATSQSFNITSGTFSQGSSYDFQAGAVTVGASGTWLNEGTGDITLGGNVSNSGIITLDSAGNGCGDTDEIELTSTSTTARTWSGSGTFNLHDLSVSYMAGSMTARSSTDSGNNTGWDFSGCGGLTVSGTVYAADRSTPLTTTPTVRIKVNGSGNYSGAADGSGDYSTTVTAESGDVLTAYLDGAAEKAVHVMIFGESDELDIDLYQDHLAVSHETGQGPITNTHLGQYDGDDDADIFFTSNFSGLSMTGDYTLLVPEDMTYGPSGNVIAPGMVVDGTMDASTIQIDSWCAISTNCTSSWLSRNKITMDNSASAENLVNFPILVKLNSSNIDYGLIQDAGQDLRFVDADGITLLSHEIETWNEAGDSFVWVKVPQIDSGSTTDFIWMYYNNAAASDGQSAESVWDTNFTGVWHLGESATCPTDIFDSTDAGLDGACLNSPDPVTAQVNGGRDISGTESIVMDTSTDFYLDASGKYSWGTWFNTDNMSNSWAVILNQSSGGTGSEGFFVQASTLSHSSLPGGSVTNGISVYWESNDTNKIVAEAESVITQGQWHHLYVTYDGTQSLTSRFGIYVNGVDVTGDSVATGTIGNLTQPNMRFGQNAGWTGDLFDGKLDEIRLSSVQRSADWIEAEHLSMTDSLASFGSAEIYTADLPGVTLTGDLTISSGGSWVKGDSPLILKGGTEQTITDSNTTKQDLGDVQISTAESDTASWWDDSWTARRKITLDNSDSAENLTNFPVLIKLDSADIDYSKTQDQGQDIRFVDADDSTELDYEIETWNEAGDSYVWVKVPQLDAGSTEDFIYMYYGNTDAYPAVNNAFDNFDRADGELGDSWWVDGDATASISSNQVIGVADNENYIGRTDIEYGPDQYIGVQIIDNEVPSGSGVELAVRSSDDGAYIIGCQDNATCYLGRWIIETQSWTDFDSLTYSEGDFVSLEAEGTTIRAYKNGVLEISVTDAELSGGEPYITLNGDSVIDNAFSGNTGSGVWSDDYAGVYHFSEPIKEVSDDFNRAELGDDWEIFEGTPHIDNNALTRAGLSSWGVVGWTADEFSENQYVQATIAGGGNEDDNVEIFVRSSSGGDDYYDLMCVYNETNGNYDCRLGENTGGTYTTLVSNAFSAELGDSIRLDALGSYLIYYKNGVFQNYFVDPTPRGGGDIGVALIGSFAALDDFAAGNLDSEFMADSSGSSIHGYKSDIGPQISGVAGNGAKLEGVVAYATLGRSSKLVDMTGSATYSAWVNTEVTAAKAIFSNQGPGGNRGMSFAINSSRNPYLEIAANSTTLAVRYAGSPISLNEWHYVVGVYDADNQTIDIYVDGVLDNGTLSGTVPSSQYISSLDFDIGRRPVMDEYWQGQLDEIRIASTTRSADWIEAEYNWSSDPDSHNAFGEEETPVSWWDDSWAARRKITIDNSNSAENLTDFPLLVKLDSTRIDYSKTQGQGQDIRFVDADDSTELSYEIETWNEAGDSYVWVKVPQLDAASTADFIYMYYGNDAAADGQDATGVWDEDFAGVWHLVDDSDPGIDSTSNNHDGAAGGSVAEIAGKINGAIDFDGGGDGTGISVGDISDTDGLTALTTSFWMNPDATHNDWSFMVHDQGAASGEGNTHGWTVQYYENDRNYLISFTNGNANTWGSTGGNLITYGSWQHVTVVYDGSLTGNSNRLKFYANGVESSISFNGTIPSSLGSNDQPLIFGDTAAAFDEMRVSSSARSADWVEAEYLTSSDAMNSFGSEEVASPVGLTTVQLGSSVKLSSVLIDAYNSLDANGSNTLTLTGAGLTNNGTWTPSTGTVVLAPSSDAAAIAVTGTGTLAFNNFTVNSTGGALVRFKSGATVTFDGAVSLNGSGSNPVYIQSDTPGVQWTADFNGTVTAMRTYVRDTACAAGSNSLASHETNYNQGNNGACWMFVTRAAAVGALDGGPGGSGAVGGSISFDAASEDDGTSGGSSISWSHTVGSGSNRYLRVGVSIYGTDRAVTGITYNGDALTKLAHIANQQAGTEERVEYWYLLNPDVGTHTISVTASPTPTTMIGGAASYTGVNQSNPHGTYNTAAATSNTASVTVSSAAGELVVDALSSYDSNIQGNVSVGSGQTERWSADGGSGFNSDSSFGSDEPGAASVTMTWTTPGSVTWAIIAVPLKPAAGSQAGGDGGVGGDGPGGEGAEGGGNTGGGGGGSP